MGQEIFKSNNAVDDQGFPTVGNVEGFGLSITFRAEDGVADETQPLLPNPQIALAAIEQRLRYVMKTKSASREVAIAITKVQEAIMWLNRPELVKIEKEEHPEPIPQPESKDAPAPEPEEATKS